jgi:hypothetical protein
MSDIGVEFLLTFGHKQDPYITKEMRKLYSAYKKRDSFHPEAKKSYLYMLIFKVIATVADLGEPKLNRIYEESTTNLEKAFTDEGLKKFKFLTLE